jgi:Uma2 family endonuclease
MSAALKLDVKMTPAQYFDFEEKSEVRHEFLNGDIIAMAGGSEAHSLVTGNAHGELRNALKNRPCRVYESNMRVKISASGLETYPDASVVCGPSKFEDLRRQALLNPLLIIEVLSDSTETYDRGKKFWHYRQLPSLQEYVLISQDMALVEIFSRQANDEWLLRTYEGLETKVRFDCLDIEILMRDLYAKTPVVGVILEET